jgi:predicted amidophosphoribosyltransferase
VRRKRTPSLAHAGAVERARTVSGAFGVPPRRWHDVEGRRILLIDDVFTTGATIGACARALRKSGARSVDVLTLARVLRPTHLDVVSSPNARSASEESRL